MFALNWGIVSLVNLEALGSHLTGVFSYAGAIVVAGLMLAYFAKIALKLYRLLKVSKSGQ